VHDTVLMGMLHSGRELADERGCLPKWDRLVAVFQPSRQRDTGTIFGGDVADRSRLSRLMNRNDVGVPEPGRGLRFAVEALAQLLIYKGVNPRNLEGNFAFQSRIVGEIDDAKVAAAQLAADLKPAQTPPGWCGGVTDVRQCVGGRGGERRKHFPQQSNAFQVALQVVAKICGDFVQFQTGSRRKSILPGHQERHEAFIGNRCLARVHGGSFNISPSCRTARDQMMRTALPDRFIRTAISSKGSCSW
jgi:hypothetical protein